MLFDICRQVYAADRFKCRADGNEPIRVVDRPSTIDAAELVGQGNRTLEECRSIFSAANEIHLNLTDVKVGASEGLDGAFDAIWGTLASSPPWTVLILDEIDHITQDANYDPSEVLYRLLRSEGKLAKESQLLAWFISNELLRTARQIQDKPAIYPSGGRVTPRLGVISHT